MKQFIELVNLLVLSLAFFSDEITRGNDNADTFRTYRATGLGGTN